MLSKNERIKEAFARDEVKARIDPVLVLNYAMFACPGPLEEEPAFSELIKKSSRTEMIGIYEDFKLFGKYMQRNFQKMDDWVLTQRPNAIESIKFEDDDELVSEFEDGKTVMRNKSREVDW